MPARVEAGGCSGGNAGGGDDGCDTSGAQLALDDELTLDLGVLQAAPPRALARDTQPPCGPASSGNGSGPFDPAAERALCPSYVTPDATLLFHDLASPLAGTPGPLAPPGWLPPFRLAYTLQLNDLADDALHRPNGLSQQNNLPPGTGFPLTPDQAKVAVMDTLFRAYAAWSGLVNATTGTPLWPAGAAAAGGGDGDDDGAPPRFGVPRIVAVTSFPSLVVVNLGQIVEVLGAILHPVTLTAQLPLFLAVAVLEKENRLVELQLAMGMRRLPYAAVTYTLNLALYTLSAAGFWAAAAALRLTFFAQTSPLLIALTLLGWGLCVCSLATLLTAALWRRQTAVIVGFAVGLFTPLLSTAVAAGIYGVVAQSLGAGAMAVTLPPALYYLTPLFGPCIALCRILYLGNFHCLARNACLGDAAAALHEDFEGGELRHALVALFVCAAGYQAFGLYLDAVLPRTIGVARHPLFCVPRGVRDAAWRSATAARRGVCCLAARIRAGRGGAYAALAEDDNQGGHGGAEAGEADVVEDEDKGEGKGGGEGEGGDRCTTAREERGSEGGLFAYLGRWAGAAGLDEHSAALCYARGWSAHATSP